MVLPAICASWRFSHPGQSSLIRAWSDTEMLEKVPSVLQDLVPYQPIVINKWNDITNDRLPKKNGRKYSCATEVLSSPRSYGLGPAPTDSCCFCCL